MRLTTVAATAAALLALTACGDDDDDNKETTPISAAMEGTWAGEATLTLGTAAPTVGEGQIVVDVNGTTATVTEVCLDGSGTLSLTGSGNEASWTGTYACPAAVPIGDCTAVTMTFTSAELMLVGDALTATAEGSATGCATTQNFTLVLAATKATAP